MRILHVNKFLYRRGGAEAYMLDLAALQRARGDEVELFGMRFPENEPARYERWFPERVDFDPPPASLEGKVRGVGRMIWSTSAARGMRAVLRDFRPDLVHLHNIYHQLSPSILRPIREAGVPAVMTLHDYKLACPTYRFLDHDRICEACVPRRFWNAPLRRCNRGSLAASAAVGLELGLHTLIRAYAPVHRFACPSRFLEAKMRAARVFPDRLRWVPNFVHVERIRPKDRPGGGVLYAGRLSREKGVDLLLAAAAARPALRIEIAGDGPERGALERMAAELGLGERVRFHGRLDPEGLDELRRGCAVAALPSRWHENMPLVLLEAFAAGLPVVATSLGGLPELIEPGTDGICVPPEDPAALGAALETLVRDPERALEMGSAARTKAEERFAPAVHLERLDAVYGEAAEVARTGRVP
jgi:glycosyltransferase involved in cell wall biosynthesis